MAELHLRTIVLCLVAISLIVTPLPASARRGLDAVERARLLAAVRLGTQGQRNRAAARLYHYQDMEANGALLRMARDEDVAARAVGVWALGVVRPKGSAALVIRALFDAHPETRRAAADAAGMLRLAKAAPGLGRLLYDKRRSVRIAAVQALSRLRESGLAVLGRALRTRGEVQLLAIEALSRIPGRRSSALLRRAAQMRAFEVRLLAAGKLVARFESVGSRVLARLLVSGGKSSRRARAARVLAKDVSKVGWLALKQALRDSSPSVRRAAADALAQRSRKPQSP